MSKVAVSIALPVYNGANFIREALESILAQGDSFDELVVSDNCSTDGTPAILAEFAARDPRVRVCRSETFLNQADNINRSVELCRNEWVQMFCHDDLFLPGALARLREVLAHHDSSRLALVSHQPFHLFSDGHTHRSVAGRSLVETHSEVMSGDARSRPRNEHLHSGRDLLKKHLACGHVPYVPAVTTAAVRRSVFLQKGGFSSSWVHFDTFLWLEILLDSDYDYLVMEDYLTLTRVHSQQVAVISRRSLRSYHDYRRFFPGFADKAGREFDLSAKAKLGIRLKPLSQAANALVVPLILKDRTRFWASFRQLPVPLWIFVWPFVWRNYRAHLVRNHELWKICSPKITLE